MFETSTFNLGKKGILIWVINFIIKTIRKGIEILIERLFSFSIMAFNMKLLVVLFIKKKEAFSRECSWFTHTSNRIYLLWNCFSNYAYLINMYITLKGIGKIIFVLVLRILLTCKFLNFTAAFPPKFKLSKISIQSSV